MPPEVRYADTNRGHVAYQVVGDGPSDLVFIGEWWNDIDSMWDEPLLAEPLERLASFSRLICFNPRGVGISDALPQTATPALDEWLDDLRSVMHAAPSREATLVGCSGGGPLSILFAATHPDRVRSLVLFNSYARFGRAPDYPAGAPDHVVEGALELIREQWGTGAVLDILAPSLADDAHMRRWWARYQRHSLSPGTAEIVQRMLFTIDVRDALPVIQAPTLVLHREDDRFIRANHGRYLAENISGAVFVELPGADHVFFAGDSEGLMDEIEAFVTGNRRGASADRVLMTLLFTDIVGSTTQAADLGDKAWRVLLDRHDHAIRQQLERFRGREVDRAGDGFFATFDGPARAVRCALQIVDAARDLGLKIRVGVHTGEVEVRGDGLSGIAVHVAARVAAMASAGEIVATATVRDLVAGSGLRFEDRGSHALKGVPDAWQVFAVAAT